MRLRLTSSLLAVLFTVLCGCAADRSQDGSGGTSPWQREVVLSYEVRVPGCLGCPNYRVEFSAPELVRFFGLRGCAVPGEQVLHAPAGTFAALRAALDEANFFNIPRLDMKRWTVDAGIVTLAYRDERRVHETLDTGRRPELSRLEERFREAATIVDQFVNPSLEVYERLLKAGWSVNAIGEDGENALTKVTGNRAICLFLLERGANVSRTALSLSVYSNDIDLFRTLARARHLVVNSEEGRELVIQAAQRSTPILGHLLATGADANSQVAGRGTALDAAASSGSQERVRMLLSKGADPRLADKRSLSLIREAAGK